jgi:DNA-directed RNA polymerase specialized sigma24 family protein
MGRESSWSVSELTETAAHGDQRNQPVSGRNRRDGLGPEAFDHLLGWLAADREQAGEAYEHIRRKLLKFFQWRGLSEAEELADRTIDRVSRKVEEGAHRGDSDPSGFFYGVARNILREHRAEGSRSYLALRELSAKASRETEAGVPSQEDADAAREDRLRCLEACLSRLSVEARELIVAYYQGHKREKIENRRALASRLGIPMNALWIRSHRLRLQLEVCIEECVSQGAGAKSIDKKSH